MNKRSASIKYIWNNFQRYQPLERGPALRTGIASVSASCVSKVEELIEAFVFNTTSSGSLFGFATSAPTCVIGTDSKELEGCLKQSQWDFKLGKCAFTNRKLFDEILESSKTAIFVIDGRDHNYAPIEWAAIARDAASHGNNLIVVCFGPCPIALVRHSSEHFSITECQRDKESIFAFAIACKDAHLGTHHRQTRMINVYRNFDKPLFKAEKYLSKYKAVRKSMRFAIASANLNGLVMTKGVSRSATKQMLFEFDEWWVEHHAYELTRGLTEDGLLALGEDEMDTIY